MSNPWLKKNPFMSMWFSNANRVANTVRAQSVAQARKQARPNTAASFNAAQAIMDIWLGTAVATKPAKTRRRK